MIRLDEMGVAGAEGCVLGAWRDGMGWIEMGEAELRWS